MTFVHVTTPEGFELEKASVNYLIVALFAKEAYTALGALRTNYYADPLFDFTNY